MPAGRPTKYNDEMCKKVKEYVDGCEDSVSGDGGRIHLKVKLPTIEGLAMHLDVAPSTVHLWAKEHDSFSESLGYLLAKQKQKLVENGLSGSYNSTIAKLILSSDHGVREKNETDVTSKGESIQGFTLEFIKPNATADQDS